MIPAPLFYFGLLWGMAASGPENHIVYTPLGKRDPFTPLRPKQEDMVETPLTEPLRRLAISELVIVGTAAGQFGEFALVQGPDRLTRLAPTNARFADGRLVGISGDWVIFRVEGLDTGPTWVTKRIRSIGE